MSDFIYIPATTLSEKENWWCKDSKLYYPFLLISAHYGKKTSDFRKKINFPDEGIIMGDSGGFQNMSLKEWKGKDVDLDPVEVFRWQETNCDVGLPVDYPPANSTESIWKKSIAISEKNFEIAEKLFVEHKQLNPESKFKYYNVLQNYGFDKERLDTWFEMASKFPEMSKSGWTLGCKPEPSPMLIAYLGMYMYSKGIKSNLHFFKTSGLRTIPVVAYLARFIDNITTDSSSWIQYAKYKIYLIRQYFGRYNITFRREHLTQLKSLPCDCPWCKDFNDAKRNPQELNGDGIITQHIALHNLYQMIEFVKFNNILKDDEPAFKHYVKKSFDSEVNRAIEFIDYCLEYGFDSGIIKFREHLKLNAGLGTSQVGNALDY